MVEIWYFETSAVNYLMGILSESDAEETKKLQRLKKRDWCISPVTLVEILQTTSFEKRDEIVRFSQRLFDGELLASPEEIIFHYINQEFPVSERRIRLVSRSNLAEVWRGVVDFPTKQINVDIDQLRGRVKHLKSFTKMIHEVINGKDSVIFPETRNGGFNCSLEQMLNGLKFIQNDAPYNEEQRKVFKLAILYLILLICCQVGPSSEITDVFWGDKGIHKTLCRIRYALENWEPLIYRGPLSTLAHMAFCQSRIRYSRGVYNDSLHALYLNYSDFLFSGDSHFEDLREVFSGTPYAHRIQIMSEVGFTKEPERGDFRAEMIII